ncbi:acetyltransferase component of pyruvate dehydrogenase complex [Alsobacter metallidurans]|uniref:Acetyltransferase component of pyruvate dehydrogenase complex n=1 Tax=Alsobacter metallidurans TaxID=340221 RepID=A0A917MJI7_9HYPH|nr:pyruvate dehydrogenase complex dihydrolipoamide acetyltransferase [Alsobacter metallidurans]GGH18088.1 acetyltransferase component of pyruvate dehydrogenase complex [Alsobacter metallidurans]
MPINILMPALSPTMEKGNLAKWLKKEGDTIKSGDVIAEIETDKATMEVEAVDEGVLAKIVVPEGTADVPVNELIALIAAEGEDPKAVAAGGGASAPGAKSPQNAADMVTAAAPAASAEAAAAPQAASAAAATEARASETFNAGAPAAGAPAAPAPQPADGKRVFASPLAKRIAKEGGLDLGRIQGSGPHGRIVERDVRAAMEGGTAKAAAPTQAAAAPAQAAAAPAAKAPAPAGSSDEAIKKLFQPGSFEEIPHDGMRRTIARRLTEARQTVPQFYLTMDCEIDALLKLREQVNSSAPKGKDGAPAWKVSVNDMVIKALAMALVRVPDANVTWTEGAMLRHKNADVGVAVALPGNGLITPIIRKADEKTLSAIAKAMKDFAARAKDRKLKPEEYQGGTTAVSNLGMFGIKDFTAVINPPHSTILAVGAGEQRPVVRKGELAVATVMSITLSCDHRAVDGALGAQLIAALKDLIENPMAMLV